MNTQTHTAASPAMLVPTCRNCDGTGEVWNGRGNGGNDPDSWVVECPDCDGEGHFPCDACGNTVPMDGYDCFACDTANALPNSLGLTHAQAEILHRALGEALHSHAEECSVAGMVA